MPSTSSTQLGQETARVRVRLPGPLRDYCGGASELTLPAHNLHAVLDRLAESHPEVHRHICEETGSVRRHINLFVNTDHMRELDGLDTTLHPGDVVTILPAVSGG